MLKTAAAQAIWAGTDFPYQCLVDARRTETFRTAIRATVKPGDVVVDAGSGSGILAFLAAEAGARAVFAVEVDPLLATCLERSVRANGLGDIVRVVCGDICTVPLPSRVDVCICEMLDTGLLDELQALVVNSLRTRGVVDDDTRMVPHRYETFVELGAASFDYYGYRILMPAHRWPQLDDAEANWLGLPFTPFSPRLLAASASFQGRVVPGLDKHLTFVAAHDGEINAIRISGCAHLTNRTHLGATNAFNGDKVLPVDACRVRRGQTVHVELHGELGAGLASLQVFLS